MAFQIRCDSCSKTFAIPDEVYERRVVGKIVTIKCKNCQTGIRIDGKKPAPAISLVEEASPGADAPSPEPAAGGFTAVPNRVAHRDRPERSVTPPASPLSKAAARSHRNAVAEEPAPAAPEIAVPALDEEELWAVDSGEGEDRELTTEEVGAELRDGTLSSETLVWRVGMDDWATIFDVPELSALVPERVSEAPEPEPQPPAAPAPAMPAAGHLRPQQDPLKTTQKDTPVAKAQPAAFSPPAAAAPEPTPGFPVPKPAAVGIGLPPMRPRALTQPGIGLADIEELRPEPASNAPPLPRQPAPKTEQALPPPPPPRRASAPDAAPEPPAPPWEPERPSTPEPAPNPFAGFAPVQRPPPPPPLPPSAPGAPRVEPPMADNLAGQSPHPGFVPGAPQPVPPLPATNPPGGGIGVAMAPAPTVLVDDVDWGKPKRRGAVVLALGAVAVVAAVIWLVSGSSEDAAAPKDVPAAPNPTPAPPDPEPERTQTEPAPASEEPSAGSTAPSPLEETAPRQDAPAPRGGGFADMFAEGAKDKKAGDQPKKR
jgi:hypothetical protein